MAGLDRLFVLETPPASLKAFEHMRGEAVFPIAQSSFVTLGRRRGVPLLLEHSGCIAPLTQAQPADMPTDDLQHCSAVNPTDCNTDGSSDRNSVMRTPASAKPVHWAI
jgi:hypothetical protein